MERGGDKWWRQLVRERERESGEGVCVCDSSTNGIKIGILQDNKKRGIFICLL